MKLSQKSATLTGLVAIVLWASVVGLIRRVSEDLGATGGAAMTYTVSSLLLLATVGLTSVREMSRRYLVWGSLLFVSYRCSRSFCRTKARQETDRSQTDTSCERCGCMQSNQQESP